MYAQQNVKTVIRRHSLCAPEDDDEDDDGDTAAADGSGAWMAFFIRCLFSCAEIIMKLCGRDGAGT